MKNRNYLMIAFLAAATLMTPMTASALSIADYEHENGSQQTASYDAAVLKTLAAAYNTQDPAIIAKYGSK